MPHAESSITRLTRRAAPAAAALLAVAGVAAARPAGAEAANLDAPRVMCSTYNPAGHALSARFGVVNHDPAVTNIPVGDFNYFDPYPLDRGQPGQFAPGYTFFDANLAVTPAVPQLAWVIWGKANVVDMDPAKLPFERPCADTGPAITAVLPGAVHPGGGGQALTIYGQGLAGATLSVAGAGVSVAASTFSTGQVLTASITVAADAAAGPRDVLVTDPDGNQVGCKGCLLLDPQADAGGAQGPAGPLGPKGDTGPAGAKGDTGPAGGKGDTGPAGPRGLTGATGPAGPAGATGPAGPAASSAVTHVAGGPVAFGRDGTATATATCPAGTNVVSGGHDVTGGSVSHLSVLTDEASGQRQWEVTARADGARSSRRLVAQATCLG